MKNYILYHKSIAVCAFTLDGSDVTKMFITKHRYEHLPLPLKILMHYKNDYVKLESKNTLEINEEGRIILETWLNDRTVPNNRVNVHKYKPSNMTTLDWMLLNNSCSLTDCYWTSLVGENVTWEKVKLYNRNDIGTLGNPINADRKYNKANSTLGGALEKYWYMSYANGKQQLMLAKKTELSNSVLNAREVIASKIYNMQGFNNYCAYKYVRNTNSEIIGCKCRVFTSEQLELITAHDLLAEYNMTQSDDVYEMTINYAFRYGMDESICRNQLEIQTLVDYLITNRDRHLGNIAFLRDSDRLNIVGMAPIFDNGSSKNLEGETPEGVENTTVNGLYNTEIECLSHVRNLNILDFSRLPSDKWIRQEYSKIRGLPERRIDKLVSLYSQKVDYLKRYR